MKLVSLPPEVLRAGLEADLERFGLPSADFEYWCQLPVWTLKQAAALSISRDPEIISPEIIEKLKAGGMLIHDAFVKKPQDVLRLSRLAEVFIKRLRQLELDARHGKFIAIPVNEIYEVKPLAFLEYVDGKNGKEPWDYLPPEMRARIVEFHGTGKNGTGKGKPLPSSGVDPESQCLEYLISEMKKSPKAPLKRKKDYLEECQRKFKGLSWRTFNKSWGDAIKETKSAWDRSGKPSSHK